MEFMRPIISKRAYGKDHKYLIERPVPVEDSYVRISVSRSGVDFNDDESAEQMSISELAGYINELNDVLDEARLMEEKNYES